MDGAEGYCFGVGRPSVGVVRPVLMGRCAFDRERIWHDLRRARSGSTSVSSRTRIWGRSIKRCGISPGDGWASRCTACSGTFRDRVLAYASTMCGDDDLSGLGTPEAFAEFATECQRLGYRAFKLHSWMPPFPVDVRREHRGVSSRA